VVCVLIAQLVVSTLIDQFGWLGAPVQTVDLKHVFGLGRLAIGAILVASR
jgi:uncharacterized membrane protein YdcZ (DUF606 family)